MYDIKIPINKYEKEIIAYEEKGIQEGLIMFYGDSYFTRWSAKYGNRELEDDIRMKDGSIAAVNHGLGGSTAEQLLYRYPRMVKPWKPRALVLKVYNNDRDRSYSPAEIIFLQSRILEYARTDMPGIKLYVCDAQPILKQKDVQDIWYYHQMEYNQRIAEYCARHADVKLVKCSCNPYFFHDPAEIGDYAKIRSDIFIEDQVHLNPKGYELYRKFWLEQLDDIL